MSQTQKCDVCDQRGLLVDSQIRTNIEGGNASLLLIAQCERCRRFICASCGEQIDPADLTGHWLTRRFRRSSIRVVCCPFDPCVPLGDQSTPMPSPLATLGIDADRR